jgi:hypothetical protein
MNKLAGCGAPAGRVATTGRLLPFYDRLALACATGRDSGQVGLVVPPIL